MIEKAPLFIQHLSHSSFGDYTIYASENGINAIVQEIKDIEKPNEYTQKACAELTAYFNGESRLFTVQVDIEHAPEFSKSVWRLLQTIPFGKTKSYQDIAIALGNIKASRAVGMANGKNPIPFIIPCHRVIGENGKLTGYALGLSLKEKLLQLEGVIQQQRLF